MPTDVETLVNRLQGTLANDATDSKLAVEDLIQDDEFILVKPAADAMAADTSTIASFKAPFKLRVVSLTICPHAALTANDTNNAVVTLGKADGAGGSSTAIGALTTNVASGNWVADTFKEVTLTAANTTVNDGQIVTLKLTKGGTGVVVPASSYALRVRRV